MFGKTSSVSLRLFMIFRILFSCTHHTLTLFPLHYWSFCLYPHTAFVLPAYFVLSCLWSPPIPPLPVPLLASHKFYPPSFPPPSHMFPPSYLLSSMTSVHRATFFSAHIGACVSVSVGLQVSVHVCACPAFLWSWIRGISLKSGERGESLRISLCDR